MPVFLNATKAQRHKVSIKMILLIYSTRMFSFESLCLRGKTDYLPVRITAPQTLPANCYKTVKKFYHLCRRYIL